MHTIRGAAAFVFSLLALLAFGVVAGCSAEKSPTPAEDTAEVAIAITQAPPDVQCLRISIIGSRTVVRAFGLTPGESTVFKLKGLPLGEVVFLANAFATSCASVDDSSVPDYSSDPVTVFLKPGSNPGVTLVMRAQASAPVTVQFPGTDGGMTCGGGGGVCTAGEQCCSGNCDLLLGPGDGTGLCGDLSLLEGPLASLPSSLQQTDFRLSPPIVQGVTASPGPDGGTTVVVDFAPDPRLTGMSQLVLNTGKSPFVLTAVPGSSSDAGKPTDLFYQADLPVPFQAVLDSQTNLRNVAASLNVTSNPVFQDRAIVGQVPILPLPATPGPIQIVDNITDSPIDPARTLFITDPSVIDDPTRTYDPCHPDPQGALGAWTLGRLFVNMAGSGSATLFAERWIETFATTQTWNYQVQPNFFPFVPGSNGTVDLANLPVRLRAIVNRIDLAANSTYGAATGAELRFIFSLVDHVGQPDCGQLDDTIIVEYGVPASIVGTCAGLQAWAQQWEALSTIPLGQPIGTDFNGALQALTDQVVRANANPSNPNGSALKQLRTNMQLVHGGPPLEGPWQMREYHLALNSTLADPNYPNQAFLQVRSLARTPDSSFNGMPVGFGGTGPQELGQWIAANPFPAVFSPLGTSIENDLVDFWSVPGPSSNYQQHVFSLNTCNGCHAKETGTFVFHFLDGQSGFLTGITVPDPRNPPRPTQYTYFDLNRRSQSIQQIANGCCDLSSCFTAIRIPNIVFPVPVPPLTFQPVLASH